MPMTTADTAPEFARIPATCQRFGLSRSRLYLLAGGGLVRFIKSGSATLVDQQSVREYLATCPPARVRTPTAAA
jgi:hypothetical protein